VNRLFGRTGSVCFRLFKFSIRDVVTNLCCSAKIIVHLRDVSVSLYIYIHCVDASLRDASITVETGMPS
jgi:hypothetical protein